LIFCPLRGHSFGIDKELPLLKISCLSYERLKVLRPSSEELGNRLQTPTLIGCMFLMNLVGIALLALRFACSCCDQLSLELSQVL
jgi:hypothetical protein